MTEFWEKIGDIDLKTFDISGLVTITEREIPGVINLMTTMLLKTKIWEVQIKIPDFSSLVNKTDYNAKISNIQRQNILLLFITISLLVKYLKVEKIKHYLINLKVLGL